MNFTSPIASVTIIGVGVGSAWQVNSKETGAPVVFSILIEAPGSTQKYCLAVPGYIKLKSLPLPETVEQGALGGVYGPHK